MTAARSLSCHTAASLSAGKPSGKRAALAYRATFAARWQRLIVRNFDSPEAAAVAFGVDGSTARKWYEGSHAPSGFAVALAFRLLPDESAHALGAP